MHYVYVLKSLKNNQIYIGCTSDLRKRFAEHNSNASTFTRGKGPWELLYYEAYKGKQDAVLRERNLKQYGSSFGHLKARIKYSIGVRKGGERRTAA